MRTLDLQAAAKVMNMSPEALRRQAKAKKIPGSKPGKKWVFIEEDLVAHIRSLYANHGQAAQGDREEEPCHFASGKTRRTGGRDSLFMDDEYKKALGA